MRMPWRELSERPWWVPRIDLDGQERKSATVGDATWRGNGRD